MRPSIAFGCGRRAADRFDESLDVRVLDVFGNEGYTFKVERDSVLDGRERLGLVSGPDA